MNATDVTAIDEVTPRAWHRLAVRVLVAAAAIGMAVQFLFWNVGWGINFGITIALLLIAGWLARDTATPRPRWTDAWIPVAALALAASVAIRGDVTLVALDVLGAIGLAGGALAAFGGLEVVRRPFGRVLQVGALVAGWALVGAVRMASRAQEALLPGRARSALTRHAPLLRGIALAVPLLILFAALFAAADAVFARWTTDLLSWEVDWDDAIGRTALALATAWVAGGLLMGVAQPDTTANPSDAPPWPNRRRMGSTEGVVILSALNALFAAFVIVQAAYLFGGLDTLEASGMTYAEYARRGFFELLLVAFLVAGLIVTLEFVLARRTRAYVLSAIILVGLTLVILASSYLRLRLYQDAYGWTELRFYVLAAICWLAIGAVAAIAALATDRARWLPHGMVLLAVIFGIGFNLIGPVRFIAEQNVARAIHPELVPPDGDTGLDVWYLSSLGTDADIVMAEALPELPPAERAEVERVLEDSAAALAADPAGQAWQAWNYSRERARALLVE